MKKGDIFFLFFIMLYLLVIGLLREHLFVSINYQSSKLFYNESFDWQLPSDLKFLEFFSYQELYYGKWLLTVSFCLLYFIPVFFIVKKYFSERMYLLVAVYSHLFVLALGGFFYLLGIITSDMERWYSFSRNLLGVLQSPIMLFILSPSFFLIRNSR